MKTFTIKPTDGTEPYEVQAESAEYDRQSGATLFKNGEDLVARLLNISFCEKPTASED